MTAERDVQAGVMRAIGAHPDVRLFRNNVGEAWLGKSRVLADGCVLIEHPRRVVYGLAPGSADLIGWRSTVITREHLGRRLAVFLGAECKPGKGGRWESQQRLFGAAVDLAGGIYGLVRSDDDARRLVGLA